MAEEKSQKGANDIVLKRKIYLALHSFIHLFKYSNRTGRFLELDLLNL